MNLTDRLDKLFRIDLDKRTALRRLGITTVEDLLNHIPARYETEAPSGHVADVKLGEKVTLFGQLTKLKVTRGWRTKIPMTTATLEDVSGHVKCVWFNQPYIGKMFADGDYVRLSGQISERKGSSYIANPTVERIPHLPSDEHQGLFDAPTKEAKEEKRLYPVYPETKGISSLWLSQHADKCLKQLDWNLIKEPLPQNILHHFHLPGIKDAWIYAHQPKQLHHAEVARKRFAFEEIFYIQLERLRSRKHHKLPESFKLHTDEQSVKNFISSLPFPLTKGQQSIVETLRSDIERSTPMHRLLQGDVGSGKTILAAIAAYSVISGKIDQEERDFTKRVHKGTGFLQVAYMAPTEILARQHFESFIKFFKSTPVKILLLTGKQCAIYPSKSAPGRSTDIGPTMAKKFIKDGSVSIIIGTHTLIQKSVEFRNIALAIIDEQHRFGIKQRKTLVNKHSTYPHLLSMTATPIPRTLALTLYGDLDVSVLDELPPGRMPVETKIATGATRKQVYERCHEELSKGRQLYVICPRIEADDASELQAVESVYEDLKKHVFTKQKIGILHGKMKSESKEEVLRDFSEGRVDILIATSVVEVGINVPNATIMIIENSERFGLAQLHQLRGRVSRGSHQGYCFLMADAATADSVQRLSFLEKTTNGFELAEHDIQIRGIGELIGSRQWGVSDTAMEALRNLKMVEAARSSAQHILEEDPELAQHPVLKAKVDSIAPHMHFE